MIEPLFNHADLTMKEMLYLFEPPVEDLVPEK